MTAFDRPVRRLAWVVPTSLALWILMLAGFSALLGKLAPQPPVQPLELSLADSSYGTPGGSPGGGPGPGGRGGAGIKAVGRSPIPAAQPLASAQPPPSRLPLALERPVSAMAVPLRKPPRTVIKRKLEVASTHPHRRIHPIAREELKDEDAIEPAPTEPAAASMPPAAAALPAKPASLPLGAQASLGGGSDARGGAVAGGVGTGSGAGAGSGSGGEGGGTGGGVGQGSQPYAMVEHPPVPVSQVLPEYPSAARARGLQGEVVLRAIVDQQGTVERQIVVVESVPLLDEAAIEALRRWRFEPGRDANNRPVRVIIQVPLRFRLR